jgi:hypothetical protein
VGTDKMTKELALKKARETINEIYSDLETGPIMTAEWETSAQKILAHSFEDYEQKLEVAREALEFYASPWGLEYGFGTSVISDKVKKVLDDSRLTAIEALGKIK